MVNFNKIFTARFYKPVVPTWEHRSLIKSHESEGREGERGRERGDTGRERDGNKEREIHVF